MCWCCVSLSVSMVVGPVGGQRLFVFGGLTVSLLLVVCFVLARGLAFLPVCPAQRVMLPAYLPCLFYLPSLLGSAACYVLPDLPARLTCAVSVCLWCQDSGCVCVCCSGLCVVTGYACCSPEAGVVTCGVRACVGFGGLVGPWCWVFWLLRSPPRPWASVELLNFTRLASPLCNFPFSFPTFRHQVC